MSVTMETDSVTTTLLSMLHFPIKEKKKPIATRFIEELKKMVDPPRIELGELGTLTSSKLNMLFSCPTPVPKLCRGCL